MEEEQTFNGEAETPTAEDGYEEDTFVREVVSLTGIESKDSTEENLAKKKHAEYIQYLLTLQELNAKKREIKRIMKEINTLSRQEEETDCETESDKCSESESETDSEADECKPSKKKNRKIALRNKERKIRALRNLYEEANLELIQIFLETLKYQQNDPEERWKGLEIDLADQCIIPDKDNVYRQLVESVCGSIVDKGMDAITGPCYRPPAPCREEEEVESRQEMRTLRKPVKKRKRASCNDRIMKNMLEKLRKMQGYLKTVSMRKGTDETVSKLQSSIDALKKRIIEVCEGHGGPILQPQSELETYEIQKMAKEIEDMKLEICQKEAEKNMLRASEAGHVSEVEREPIPSPRENTKHDQMRALLNEQAEELDIYSKKYEKVKEKVDKQALMIDRIDENNMLFQQQIDLQLKEIKYMFEDKLTDLQRYPAKVDITRIKFKAVAEEKEEIKRQLRSYCRVIEETRKLQEKDSKRKRPNCTVAIKKCLEHFWQLQKGHKFCAEEKETEYKKLIQMKAEMQNVKTRSAAVICAMSEETEAYKRKKKDQIQDLECKLQKCRASACLAIGDREDEIKELECKIEETSCKFDKAQEKIRKLMNTLECLVKQKSKPSKDDCKV